MRLVALAGLLALAASLASCAYPKWVYEVPEPAPPVFPLPELKPAFPSEPAVQAAGPSDQVADRVADRVAVARGDTLYAIARRHEVPVRELIEANGLKPPYTLLVGQLLTLPAVRRHLVIEGDTVYGISRRYGVDMSVLVRLNSIDPPYTLQIGRRLLLPAAIREVSLGAVDGAAGAVSALEPQPAAALTSAPRAQEGFAWPVSGQLLSSFGPKPGNLHNDGINISVEKGALVRASERGVVAYVGNEIRGYGYLLLIRHDGGWVSAYAHNDALLVARGEAVERGQVVALAGATGSVSSPQLHFELRRHGDAVDPLKYLAGS